MSNAHQWNLPETRLPLGELPISAQLQTQIALQEDVTFTDTQVRVVPLARFSVSNLTHNSVLVDLNSRKPIIGFENDTMRAKFKLRSKRVGVEITPFTTQIPMMVGVHVGEDSSLSVHMRF